jgi:hypothetical protein
LQEADRAHAGADPADPGLRGHEEELDCLARADYRRDRASVEAYNRRLEEKRCKAFDLVKELQPKPAAESPTPIRK